LFGPACSLLLRPLLPQRFVATVPVAKLLIPERLIVQILPVLPGLPLIFSALLLLDEAPDNAEPQADRRAGSTVMMAAPEMLRSGGSVVVVVAPVLRQRDGFCRV
jgi:hypothetical protein